MDFRTYLQKELVARIKKNPRYSLRACAQALDLDASTLSKMLKGKRPMGKKTILHLSTKLGVPKSKVLQFLKAEGEEDATSYQMLALDQFAVISEWYHFAIMELISVDNFQPDLTWIAKALGIKKIEAEVAVNRLIRVGMLKIEDGKWQDLSSGFTTNIGPDMFSSAHRQLQEQLLTKAIAAQTSVKIDQRDHSAMTMAIDSSKIAEAKERIRKFRRSLTSFLTESETKDAVFNLNITLFPLTKNKDQGEKYEN